MLQNLFLCSFELKLVTRHFAPDIIGKYEQADINFIFVRSIYGLKYCDSSRILHQARNGELLQISNSCVESQTPRPVALLSSPLALQSASQVCVQGHSSCMSYKTAISTTG